MNDCFEKIYNSFLANKMGHAFLIETNNIDGAYKQILELAKKINCPLSFSHDCQEKCDICFQVDNSCLPSIKCIEPIGQTIKKEQIIEVKDAFNSNSLVTKYNIYIIKNAEKLNSSSANVLLKFLEEPTTETIAFFILNNKKNIIPTIKSRCQVFNCNFLDEKAINEEDLIDTVATIFKNLFSEKSASFIKNKELVLSAFKDRKDQEQFLNFTFNLLTKEINSRLNNEKLDRSYIFCDFSTKNLIKIIQRTKEIIEKTSYNVNMELLLDDYFIKIGELI